MTLDDELSNTSRMHIQVQSSSSKRRTKEEEDQYL